MLLMISSMDISDYYLSSLKQIHERLLKDDHNNYKIIWIPIVEQWTDETRKKFDMLNSKMPWYIVQSVSSKAGMA